MQLWWVSNKTTTTRNYHAQAIGIACAHSTQKKMKRSSVRKEESAKRKMKSSVLRKFFEKEPQKNPQKIIRSPVPVCSIEHFQTETNKQQTQTFKKIDHQLQLERTTCNTRKMYLATPATNAVVIFCLNSHRVASVQKRFLHILLLFLGKVQNMCK